jgi:predicted GIY-YIG superfamily endonuclease
MSSEASEHSERFRRRRAEGRGFGSQAASGAFAKVPSEASERSERFRRRRADGHDFRDPDVPSAGQQLRTSDTQRQFSESFSPSLAGQDIGSACRMPYPAKRFVYVIRRVNHPTTRYVGVTSDIVARLSAHNAGQNRSTARWKPWNIDVIIEFRTERMALRFEKYLKSGAGHAFAGRYFVDEP